MVRGIANSKIGFGDLILLLRYFFKLKVSTHPTDYRLFSDAYFEHFLFTNLTPKPKKTQTKYCFTIRYNQSTKSHDTHP